VRPYKFRSKVRDPGPESTAVAWYVSCCCAPLVPPARRSNLMAFAGETGLSCEAL